MMLYKDREYNMEQTKYDVFISYRRVRGDTQFNLGWRYENGRGITKNDEEAVKWYRKAAEQGNENAKNALKKLAGK